MIECITGYIVHQEADTVVVETGGIGYLVHCGNPYRYQINHDEKTTIYTYQHVREDAVKLFGFTHREERRLFEKLLQVSGIGPKGALAIVGSEQPRQVVEAIEEENVHFLTKFPGVGKKTAGQIVLDLKGKVGEIAPTLSEGLFAAPEKETSASQQELEDALEALRALGYTEREIKKVTPSLEKEDCTTDEYIKLALKKMLNA
ncbi:Holliday junction branch migration protein RuvA [Alkalicoccus urumqiensis]|uniref:Holliday junction branch migration complex subunit RuvA n=1 Tax=Alkalicoccus urumqiensis TaxID=1548213 RepID=A0A2P6MFI3_ALKUR|nr:Holliday junction branch migration protein RuvA [Alkalicoccus urumqiensis]PRO65001.1 Holliday junction branch migration protein RuvA [Alkalicoccus urumqiensis]